jgi:hypothetical protein
MWRIHFEPAGADLESDSKLIEFQMNGFFVLLSLLGLFGSQLDASLFPGSLPLPHL